MDDGALALAGPAPEQTAHQSALARLHEAAFLGAAALTYLALVEIGNRRPITRRVA